MNPSIVNTKYILFITVLFLVGVHSRSVKKQESETCVPVQIRVNVTVPTCITREVTLHKCQGNCLSCAVPSNSMSTPSPVCNCCRSLDTNTVRVFLFCKDSNGKAGPRPHDILSAATCSCLPCQR